MTNDHALAEKIRMIANHGQSERYYHDVVGCNSRLDTIQAAILRIKLRKLDEYIGKRNYVASYYDRELGSIEGITVPARVSHSNHVFHQYTMKLDGINRDELNAYLASKDIPSMIYYPVPGHRQKMFASFNLGELDMPVTDDLTTRVISLPIHTEFEDEQLKYICDTIKEFINR
jgi:dTDP-4-amino-4,6-dideoxygalactose transaminase